MKLNRFAGAGFHSFTEEKGNRELRDATALAIIKLENVIRFQIPFLPTIKEV